MNEFRYQRDEPLDPDRFGSYHQDRDQEREANPRGGQDEARPLLRCPMCGRPVAAMADCATCGDETDRVAA